MPNKRFTNHLFLFPSDALPKGPHILGLASRPTQPSIRLLRRRLHLNPLPLAFFFPPSQLCLLSRLPPVYFLFFPIHIPPSIATHFFSHLHPSLLSTPGPSSAPPFHFLFLSLRLSVHSPIISLFPSTLPLFLSLIVSNFVFLLCLFFILPCSSTSSKSCLSFSQFPPIPLCLLPSLCLLHPCVHPPYFHLTSLFIAPTSLSFPHTHFRLSSSSSFDFYYSFYPPTVPFTFPSLFRLSPRIFLIPILFPPSIPALYPLPFFPEVSVFTCFSFFPIFLPPRLT